MSALVQFAGTIITVLAIVAIASRLFSAQQTAGTVSKGTDAVANIFRGVFRG